MAFSIHRFLMFVNVLNKDAAVRCFKVPAGVNASRKTARARTWFSRDHLAD